MTTDIKELAQWLRANGDSLQSAMGLKHIPFRLTAAADALEAMAGEVGRLKASLNEWVRENAPGGWIDTFRNQAAERDRTRADYEAMKAHNKELFGKLSAAEVERDRLKAALQAIEQGDYYGCVSEFALKALGGDA